MIDFHAHILPGIDDGSRNVYESLAMLEASVEQGVKTIVATPHFYPWKEKLDVFLKQRDIAVKSLINIGFPILLGAEVAYFDGIEYSDAIARLKISDTKLLLVEMPMVTWSPRMIEALHMMEQRLGIKVVLAHVDRYIDLQRRNSYIDYVSEHFLVQINANYFINRHTQRKAIKLIKNDRIDFIGSDCHNMTSRPPNVGDACQIIQKKLGIDGLSTFCDNQMGKLQIIGRKGYAA